MTEEEKQAAALEETTVPADDGTTDETAPDGTTDDTASDESTSETAEQTASREAHFQKLNDERMARLDALDGTGRLSRIARGEEEVKPTAQDHEDLVGEMTKAELGQFIASSVRGPVTAAQREAERGRDYTANYDGANAEFQQFNKEHGISAEEAQAAEAAVRQQQGILLMHEVDADGQPGRQTPTQLVRAYITAQQLRGVGKATLSQKDKAAAAAKAKVDAANQLSQPSGGSAGEPKDMTEDNKLLEQMNKAGTSKASKEFWDKK